MSKGICRIVSIALIVLMLATVGPLEGLAVTMQPKKAFAEMSSIAEPLRVDAAAENAKDKSESEGSSEAEEEQDTSSGEKTFSLREKIQRSQDQVRDQYAAYLARKVKSNSAAPAKAPKKAGENDGITYRFDDATKTLTFTGTGALDDYGDTENLFSYDSSFDMSTMPPWYAYAAETETVVVGEGITALGNCSFMLFSQLKTVQLPTTLTRIGDYSFAFTDALETITLPSGLTELGYGAFLASGLPAIDVSSGVAELNGTFSYCWNLHRVILHEGLQVLDGALEGVVLQELTIPSTVNNAAGNYLFGLHLLYNYSKNATFIQDTQVLSSSPVKEDAWRGYIKLMAQGNKPGFNWEEFDEYEVIQELLDRLNEKYGTAYTIDDFGSLLESNPSDAEITVYCYDDSQEHDQVKNLGYKHYIIQEDGTLSDSLCPDYGTGTAGDAITWHMDFETHTLIFEGHGRMTVHPYHESDYPWTGLVSEVEAVWFVGDEEGQIENLVSYAFTDFTNLKTVILPDGMTTIDRYAFDGCSALQRVEIGSALESLDYGVFYDCSSLTELILSEDNPTFYLQDGCLFKTGNGGDTLYFCMPNVTQLVLEDEVIGVESGAFSAANALEQLTVNDRLNLSSCGLSACKSLNNIILNETNTKFCIVDGVLYNKDMTTLIFCPRNKETVDIPNTVKTISGGAFSYCNAMKELVLPESVTSARYAFEDCTGLESITFLCTRCDLELLPRQIVIYGYAGSSIETFARDNGYQFVPIYTIVSAELKSAPTQTMYYTVENLHTSGLTITVTYENGTVADITNGFKVSGFVKGQVGTQTLTVEYQGYTFHFDVQVEEVPEIIAGTQETIDKSTAHFPMYWRFTPAFDGEFLLTANGSFSVYHQNLNYDSHIVFYGSDVRFTAEAGETYYIELDYLNSSSDDETVYLRHNHVFDANLSETCTVCGGRIGAWMQGACGDQLNYTLYDEGTLVLTGSGQMTSAPWRSKSAYIKRVFLPDGLTTISESAFANCRQLQSIIIPPSVEVISSLAFYNCYQLSSIVIENPRCSIEYIDIPEQATIYGYLNSTAEAYANRYNRTFVSIDIDSVELKSPPTKTVYQRWEDLDTTGLTLSVVYTNGRTIEDTSGFTVSGFNKGVVGTQTLTVSYFGHTMTFDVMVEDYPTLAAGTSDTRFFKNYETAYWSFVPAFDGVYTVSLDAQARGSLSVYDGDPISGNSEEIAGQSNINSYSNPLSVSFSASAGATYYIRFRYTAFSNSERTISLKHQHVEALPFTGFCGLCGEPLETIAQGSCGEGVQYTLYQEGTLVISGSGEMTSYPGYTYRAKQVIVQDGVTSIRDSAFSSCSELVSVDLADTVTSIGSSAFSNCSKLESIKLSASLASVGAYAFRDCPSLSEIVLPAQLSTIGNNAFENCTALTAITIPAGLEIVASAAFKGCTVLESVTLSETVTRIDTSAFESCSALKAITIPASVTKIGERAFAGSGLETISFAGNTELAGSYIFDQTELNQVILLDGVSSFNTYDWDLVNSLATIAVSESNTSFSSVDGVLYNKDQTKLICCPQSKTTLQLPHTVTEIGDCSVAFCRQLTDVTLSPGLTKIGKEAFYACSALETINIPETVSFIDEYAFASCSSLTSIAVPSAVTSLSPDTFAYCSSLKEVVIPDSVTNIGAYAFYRCAALESIEIPETVTSIDTYTFAYCSSLNEVMIPDSVTSIESYAFLNCSALEAIGIPESITVIKQGTFSGCSALASVSVDTTETATLLGPKIEAEETHIVSGDPNWKKSADLASGGRCLDKGKDFDFMLFVNREGTYTLSERACYNNRSFNLFVDGVMFGTYSPDFITTGNNDRYYTDFEIAAIPLSTGFHTIRITASDYPPIFDYFTVTSEAEGEAAFAKTEYAGLAQIGANAFASCNALSSVQFTGTILDWSSITIASGNEAFINAVQDHSHVFGDAAVIDAASCTQKGTSHYVCDACGFEVRFEVEKLPHEYEMTEHAAEDGHEAYKEFICRNCGDSYTELYPAVAVEGFTGEADTDKITLSWLKAVEASVTGYQIFRKTADEEDYSLLKTISSRTTLSYVDRDLEEGVYAYKIRAMKDQVEGVFADAITISTEPDTEAPRVVSAAPKNKTVQHGTVSVSAAAEDNVGVTGISVFASVDSETWNKLSDAAGNRLQYSLDTTAYPDGTLYLKYVATDKAGNQSDDYVVEYTLDNTGPVKVSGIRLIAVYAASATLSWDADENGETYSYTVQKYDNANDAFVLYKANVKTTGMNLSGLQPDAEHRFRVAGVDAYGNVGAWSDEFSFRTLADTSAPVITKQSPASCSVKDQVTYTVTITDDAALAGVTFRISQNGSEWTTLAEKSASGTAASVSYTYDLTGYEEGPVYVSAVATDAAGNRSSAPFTEYRIDRTAPAAPQGLKAVGRDGSIDISWADASGGDASTFRLYRSGEESGEYKLLKQGAMIAYADSAVTQGTTYWYKVCAVDAAGNISGYTDAVFAAPTEDVTSPAVASITLSANKRTATVRGADNHFTDSIVVEYTLNGNDYTAVSVTCNVKGAVTLATAALPAFDNGKNVTIRVKAVDAAGNESDWSYLSFTFDADAPTVKHLQADLTDGTMSFSWEDGKEEDLAGFEIYYAFNGGAYKLFAKRAISDSHAYTVSKSMKSFANGSYQFRVDAIDTSENRRSYETDSFEHTQGISGIGDGELADAVKAVILVPAFFETEVEERFDASGSYAVGNIVSYEWSFGDGTTATGAVVNKAYNTEGTYAATLTITDSYGNTDTAEMTINVQPRAKYGFAAVTVQDEHGRALSGATVCMNFGEEDQFSALTNSAGVATIRVTEGTHTVAASNGADYLPASGQIKVVAGETAQTTLTLENGTIMTSELSVKKMTLDEIVAAGISVSDPANNSYYSGEITIYYREKIIHYTYVRTDTEIVGYTIDVPGGPQPVYIPNDGGIELIAFIFIPIKAGFLKEFYNVNFTVCNNASPEFAIDDLVATVEVPNGMTLMSGLNGFENTAQVRLGTITGGSNKTVAWCLRADRAGTHNISVSGEGTLRGFETPLYTSQTSTITVKKMSERMQVVAEFPEGIYVQMKKWRKRIYRMEDPSLYIAAEKFDAAAYFNVGFENIDDEDLYCPTLDVDAVRLLFKTDNLKDKLDIEETGTYVVGADGTRTEVTGEDVQVLHAGEKYLKYFKITFSDASTNGDFQSFMNKIRNFRAHYHEMESDIFLSHSSDPDMELDVTLDSAFFDQLYYGRAIPVYEEKFSEDPYLKISLADITSHGDHHQFEIGETNQLTAELMPDEEMITEGLTWTADDQTAFSVSSSGAVKAKAVGETYVSVSDEDYASKGEYCLFVEKEESEGDGSVLVDLIMESSYIIKKGLLYDSLGNRSQEIPIKVKITNLSNDLLKDSSETGFYLSYTCDSDIQKSVWISSSDTIEENIDFGETKTYLFRILESDLADLLSHTNYSLLMTCELALYSGNVDIIYCKKRIGIGFDHSKEKFIPNYSFDRDSYSFENIDDVTEGWYYEKMFGVNKGRKLFKKNEDGSKHGHCYGMAISTSSIFQKKPNVQDFSKSTIRELRENSCSAELQIDLKSFIKYCQIYQLCDEIIRMKENNSGYTKVLNAVKKSVEETGKPIHISLRKRTASGKYEQCHAVLAVGYDGDDILVNDSNWPDYIGRIRKIDYNNWYYQTFDSIWDSTQNGTISYTDDTTSVYLGLVNYFEDNPSIHKNLVDVDQGVDLNDYSRLTIVSKIDENVSKQNQTIESNLYWIDDSCCVNAQNNNSFNSGFDLIGNDYAFNVSIPANARVKAENNDQKAYLEITSQTGESITLSVSSVYNENQIAKVEIQGTVNDENVHVDRKDDGIHVIGLDNMTLTYSIDDEVIDTVTVPVTDGREVNIIVDETTNEITTDFACDHDYVQTAAVPATCVEPGSVTYTCSVCGESYVETLPIVDHKDDDEDGLCDFCNEKMTGGNHCKYCGKIHKGFGGFFTKIIHAILYFFAHLFRRM